MFDLRDDFDNNLGGDETEDALGRDDEGERL